MADLTGKRYPPVLTRLDAERCAEFARVLGDDPDQGVPPTFAAVYALKAAAARLFEDPESGITLSGLLHSEQEFEWRRHPEPGESLTVEGTVTQDLARRGMRFVTYRIECRGADGEVAVTAVAGFVVRQAADGS